jgi:uncharacterized protein YebE (UPF0316 family)
MFNSEFLNSPTFTWIILPVLIFLARLVDVSFGTLRIIFLARGRKWIAPMLGFFEIMIWLLAIGQIFKNLNNFACYVAYAAGFATGNFVGIWIEQKLAIGMQVVRIITKLDANKLIRSIRSLGYGLTVVDGEGTSGPVKILYTLIRRKDMPKIVSMIQNYNPKAFYSVEDVRLAASGIFPESKMRPLMSTDWLRMVRKGK